MTKFLQKVPIMNNWPLCAVPWLIKKSKMAHSGHLEFNKMLISLYQIKLFEPNLVQSSSTRLQTFKNVPNSLNMKTQDGSHCYLGKMWSWLFWYVVTLNLYHISGSYLKMLRLRLRTLFAITRCLPTHHFLQWCKFLS